MHEYKSSAAAYYRVYSLLQLVAVTPNFAKGARVSTAHADFADQLHRQGYRLTPQRHLILDIVRKAGAHVTPEQVYARVYQQNPAVSRATIYRTLDFLCEVHMIHAMQWGDRTYYEIAGDKPHHHLI